MKVSVQELYTAAIAISGMKSNIEIFVIGYYLEQILDTLQQAFAEDDERCAELAELEWLCSDVLEWDHMKCMQKIMRNDPNFYALLVSIIYKTDDNGASDEAKRTSANKVYSGFNKAKFCPTEKDGR